MPLVIAFLMTLMLVPPHDGAAQAVSSPGDRVRIKQVGGAVFTGTLTRVFADTIELFLDSSQVGGSIAIPRSKIATLERQQGTHSRSNVLGVVGVLAGGAIALITRPDRSCDGFLDYGCVAEAHANAVVRVGIGMITGGFGGALIGMAFRTEHWVVAPLIEVAPGGQRTAASVLGLGLRFTPGRRAR